MATRTARLALGLWMIWAVIVWNVVFDHVIVVAGREYVRAAVVAATNGSPYAREDDWMRPALPRAFWSATTAAGAIADGRLNVKANCAARTVDADIQPIAEITERTGVPIECCTFIGSSPIRQYAEGWTLDFLRKCTEDAISFAVKQGLTVMYVTED